MRKLVLVLFLIAITKIIGQNKLEQTGNVGIGTKSPSEILQIGDFRNTKNLKLSLPGVYNFEQAKLGQYGNGSCGLEFVNHNSRSNSYGVRLYSNTDNGIQGLQIQTAPSVDSYEKLNYTTRLAINTNGNVGIGTIKPNAKLAVNGNIHTKEVKVDLKNWADFVFDKDYELPNLSEVENHIKQNGRLKDIPSAKEVEKNGVNLGEMNKKLLQKIEELTLYTIQQQKEINSQKKVIILQRNKNTDLENRLSKLENLILSKQKN